MITPLLGIGLALSSPAAASREAGADFPAEPLPAPIQFAQVIVRSRVIIRVQTDVAVPMEVVEKKGPKCVPLASLAGYAVAKPDSVDLALRGGERVRARFSSRCPTLDYYSGFYIVPNPDGMVCADRDVVRSRAGGECPIERIRTLVIRPKKK